MSNGSPALVAAFAALAMLPGCFGEDSPGFGGDSEMYDDPGDFDRRTCDDAAASVDSVDPAGIWHANVVFADGMSVVVFRIDAGVDAALVYGEQTDDVRRSSDDLFIRSAQNIDGIVQVVAIDLCGVDEEGLLIGQMATCYDRNCSVGRVTAYPVAPFDDVEAENMTLVSEWRGPPGDEWTESVTLNVRHVGTVAYVVGIRDGLRIVDLADPADPADLGQLPSLAGEYFNDVKLATAGERTYAYLASSARGVVLVDVTDPSDPVELATFPEPGIGESTARVHTLFIEGDRLYAALTSAGGIVTYDIGDPADPVELGTYVHPMAGSFGGFVHDLSVRDGIAYLNYWNLGMIAVDTRDDPANPTEIGVFDDYDRRTSHSNWVTEAGGRLVAVHGDEDFDSHVRIVDVDPASSTAFKQIGAFRTRPQVSVHNIMAVGELALASYYQDGLRVLDLADPEKPTEVAHFASWRGVGPDYGLGFFEGAIGVDYDAERDLILLADTHRGLIVLRLDELE